jgi:hypothetical protein
MAASVRWAASTEARGRMCACRSPAAHSSACPAPVSLVTIAALVAGGNSEQLPFQLNLGKQNGLTQTEWCTMVSGRRCGTWPS